jgi:hypothetical protein
MADCSAQMKQRADCIKKDRFDHANQTLNA